MIIALKKQLFDKSVFGEASASPAKMVESEKWRAEREVRMLREKEIEREL